MEIIAHRGASHDAPENTIAAAREAWKQGADGIEFDVRLTQDRRVVVIHDATATRTTGRSGTVAEMTFAELAKLDAGSWKSERFRNERIPSVEAMLDVIPPDKHIFIEIKSGVETLAPLQAALAGHAGRSAKITLIGFDFGLVRACKTALPEHEACWIIGANSHPPFDEVIRRCSAAGLDGLDFDRRIPIDTAAVDRIRAAGLKAYAWTVNSPETARRLAAAGIDAIATDRPGWMRGNSCSPCG